MTKQCSSCGGFCKGKHCERANVGVPTAPTKESVLALAKKSGLECETGMDEACVIEFFVRTYNKALSDAESFMIGKTIHPSDFYEEQVREKL